ncbi:MAG: metallophosphoesterase [Candidatus Woesearchaeota archaeon]
MKTYKKVLLLGDLHLGDIHFNLEKELIEVINSDKFDCIVIGGDTFDPWRGEDIEEIMIKYQNIFHILRSKRKVIFIKGNHDKELEELEKSGFVVRTHFEYLTQKKRKVKVLHGHEFDKYRKMLGFMGIILAYGEEKVNRILKWFRIPIALRIARLGFGIDKPTIWLALRKKYYLYSDCDVLVYGHTHIPMHRKVKDVLCYNWGSWQRDRGYRPSYIINRGEEFNIEFLHTQKRRLIWHFISVLNNIKEGYINGKEKIKKGLIDKYKKN